MSILEYMSRYVVVLNEIHVVGRRWVGRDDHGDGIAGRERSPGRDGKMGDGLVHCNALVLMRKRGTLSVPAVEEVYAGALDGVGHVHGRCRRRSLTGSR